MSKEIEDKMKFPAKTVCGHAPDSTPNTEIKVGSRVQHKWVRYEMTVTEMCDDGKRCVARADDRPEDDIVLSLCHLSIAPEETT